MTAEIDTRPVVVDSSGWIEYWADGPKAELFDPYFGREENVVLPTIVLYEVFKKLMLKGGSNLVDRFLSFAYRTRIIDLDDALAVAAAENSIKHKLAMADAIVFTTAAAYEAELVTMDNEFQGLQGVVVL